MKKGIILLLFCCLTAAAQRPVETSLRFDSTTWDFGLIKEADGVVSHEFNYINLSDHEVVLEFVTPGCSCTTTTYSRSPLPPGQAAAIVVHFDPASQPGQFHQTVQIVLKGGKERYNLIVEGVVAEREKDVDQAYPFPLVLGLQVSSLTARFGFVQQGRSLVKTVGIANTSGREIQLDYTLDRPDKDIVVRMPQALQAGQTGLVEIDFSPEPGRIGTLDNGVAIFPKGEAKGKSVALEGYAVQTVDKKPGAASLRFQPTQLDFGKVKTGRKAKASVTLFNDGKEDLRILKMEIPDAITVNIKQNVSIAPGKTMKLEAVLLLNDKYFRQDELRVRLFTNDPNRPIRDIVCRLSVN
ncbi:MAG: DUF1573 domain-containing protein [Bacteroidales bacterium]|nr:DUF1573 domain-containing protein [Bacteroidales bacterium]